ncbi:DUF1566 domain-containing protein [Exilibacterium tricleocarpae]|nr:DUF1566 domain-containing protein [Exilibacterium tricleocarpae]
MATLLSVSIATGAEQTCQPDSIPATAPEDRYTRHADGTVTDKQTGLMWQMCSAGLSGDGCATGAALAFSWAEALLYPATINRRPDGGGYTDWRLPNIRELASLAELQCAQPAINLAVFPNTPSAHVWSSSPYQFYAHYSWYMDFDEGIFIYGERIDNDKHIRLVRDATSP